MRSFTDVFIKHPVLAVVVNLVIVLVGVRALLTLPVQQFPSVESSSVDGARCRAAAAATRTSDSSLLRESFNSASRDWALWSRAT